MSDRPTYTLILRAKSPTLSNPDPQASVQRLLKVLGRHYNLRLVRCEGLTQGVKSNERLLTQK